MTGIRMAIAQPSITPDASANGKKIRSLMRKAAEGRARLVHFPEGMLSGDAQAELDPAALRSELEQIMALAAELKLWVVLGSAHPLTAPHRPHNSLYVISDAGTLVDRYDKRYLSRTEVTHHYTPGFDPVVFDIDGYRFGTLLCVEVNFPQLFQQYERLGVECLLLSAYDADELFQTKAATHAAINCYWISVSLPSDATGSGLITPAGLYTTQLAAQSELAFASIDREDPDQHIPLRATRPWRATAAKGDVYRARAVTDPRSTDRTRV